MLFTAYIHCLILILIENKRRRRRWRKASRGPFHTEYREARRDVAVKKRNQHQTTTPPSLAQLMDDEETNERRSPSSLCYSINTHCIVYAGPIDRCCACSVFSRLNHPSNEPLAPTGYLLAFARIAVIPEGRGRLLLLLPIFKAHQSAITSCCMGGTWRDRLRITRCHRRYILFPLPISRVLCFCALTLAS